MAAPISPDSEQPIVIHPEIQGEVDVDVPVSELPLPPDIWPPTRGPIVTMARPEVIPTPPELTVKETKRAFSLDALRGLFLVSMTLGFTVGSDIFPAWMYHRQMPPPDYGVADIPGISWRDLAYGAFLFTMAAALPLTLSRRIGKGETELGIVFGAIRRYFMLLVFALLIGHSNTYFTGYTQTTRLVAIAGFVVMALIFTRRRSDWNAERHQMLNRAGWLLAIAFLALTPLLYGKSFSFYRIDDVISGLAFAALAGSVIWYLTRDNLTARIAVLGAAVALYLGARSEGWVQDWWWSSPVSWAFQPSWFTLLTIVIPGTIAGDLVLRWMRSADPGAVPSAWTRGRVATVAAIATALTPIAVFGLYNRAVQLTTQVSIALILAGVILTWRPSSSTERMLRSLFVWGGMWLVLGLFLEPFENGIRKVPDTLSYFFTLAGLTTMLLVALTALVDVLDRRKWVAPLIDVGTNPLLMYVMFTILINSTLELIPPMRDLLQASPGEAILRSAIQVTLVVLVVRYVTRKHIYWRT